MNTGYGKHSIEVSLPVELIVQFGYNPRPVCSVSAGKRNSPIRSCWGARKGQADGWWTLTLNTLE
jgi:hypothetical protein